MNIESPASKTTKKPKTINKVIQDHFESVEKGTFNVASFNAGFQNFIPIINIFRPSSYPH